MPKLVVDSSFQICLQWDAMTISLVQMILEDVLDWLCKNFVFDGTKVLFLTGSTGILNSMDVLFVFDKKQQSFVFDGMY